MTEKKGLKVNCNNCGHQWHYNGRSEFYTSCPRCRYNINLKKIKKDQEVEDPKKNQ